MKPDERPAVDERLAALKSTLERVPAPPLNVTTASAKSTAQAQAQIRHPVRRKRRLAVPVTLAAAASFLLAVLAFTRPWSSGEPTLEPLPASLTVHTQGDYLAAPVLVPVAVHSATRGPELHYLDAQIVRDRQGNTRVVFVGSITEE